MLKNLGIFISAIFFFSSFSLFSSEIFNWNEFENPSDLALADKKPQLVTYESRLNYLNVTTPEDVLRIETTACLFSSSIIDRIKAFLARGETYLLLEDEDGAAADFLEALHLVSFLKEEEKILFRFQALFGAVIAFSMKGLDEVAFDYLADLSWLVKIKEENDQKTMCVLCSQSEKILGPDKISAQECLSRVGTTAKLARILISKARLSVQSLLYILIDEIEIQANICCKKGGLWKECLGPLVNKWSQWNNKWKVFGIPPDPSWD